jgi:hypothetical protein
VRSPNAPSDRLATRITSLWQRGARGDFKKVVLGHLPYEKEGGSVYEDESE